MKIKALILAFVLIFGCTCAYAQETPVAKSEVAVSPGNILDQLGITDGINFSDAQNNITRAQFASMIVKAMNVSKTSYSTVNYFSDVKSGDDFADEIATLCYLGIAGGTGEGRFSPNDGVTLGAAYKMITTALGYNEWALAYGGWPTGYVRMAGELDLDNLTNKSTDAFITLSDACALIEEMLKTNPADVGSVSKDGVEFVKAEETLLERSHNLHAIEGVCVTAGSVSVDSGFEYDKTKTITLDYAHTFKTNVEDVEDFLGYEVLVWYDKDTDVVKCIEATDNNTTVELDADVLSGMTDYSVLTSNEQTGKETKYNLDRGYSYVKNGRLSIPEKDAFDFDNGKLVLIDNNGDKKYDFVIAHRAEYFVVSSFSEYDRTIYDKNLGNVPIVFESNGDNYCDITVFDNDGNPISETAMTSIKQNMILTVFRSSDGKYVNADACTSTVKGSISEIGKDFIVINGNSYKKNYYYDRYYGDIGLGYNGVFLLAPDGTVTAVDSTGYGAMQYSYYLDFKVGPGLSTTATIKLLSTSSEICIYNLASKIKLNGVSVAATDSSLFDVLYVNGYPNYQAIRYSLNADGLVNAVDTGKNIDESADAVQKYSGTVYSDDSLTRYVDKTEIHYKITGLAYPYFKFGSGVVFKVPKNLTGTVTGRYDDNLFSVMSYTELKDDDKLTVDAYDYNENFEPGVVVAYIGLGTGGRVSAATPPMNATAYVVDSVVDAIDSDGEITKKVTLYDNGKFLSYYIDERIIPTLEDDNLIPASGDIVRIVLSDVDTIGGIARDVIYNPDTKKSKVQYGGDVSANPGYMNTYITGKVFSVSSSMLTVKYEDIGTDSSKYSPTKDGISPYAMTSVPVIAIYNTDKGIVEHGSFNDILSIQASDEAAASYIALKTYYLSPRLLVIYK